MRLCNASRDNFALRGKVLLRTISPYVLMMTQKRCIGTMACTGMELLATMVNYKKFLLETVQRTALAGALGAAALVTMPAAMHVPAQAQSVPLPSPRPNADVGAEPAVQVKQADPQIAAQPVSIETTGSVPVVAAVSGSLKQGLEAISGGSVSRALGIAAGMREGSLERKILSWSIALSGKSGVPSSEIARTAIELPDWPGQETMRRNSEAALAGESLSPQSVIRQHQA
jgi:soluble lytic murein transglycosylase